MSQNSDDTLDHAGGNAEAEKNETKEEPKNEPRDDGERGETKPEEQPPVGFWHSSLNSTRFDVFKSWAITTLILMIWILAVLSLYWAALFRVEQNMSSLIVWVVDFDGQVDPYKGVTPVVGPQIVKAAEMALAPSGTVGWQVRSPADFNYDPMEVRSQVYDFKAWGAIIINANATALLQDAVHNGNSSYDPLGAAQTVIVSARDDTTHYDYVDPQLTLFQIQVTSTFGEMWAKQMLAQAASNATLLSNMQKAPQAISPAIGFSMFDLRPFYPPVATPAITIGLIYLIIVAFFSFTFYLPHHMKFISSPGHRPMKVSHYIIWRWIATVTAYFFLSWSYSIISLAFQIPFTAAPGSHTEIVQPSTQYGNASFVVYWMINWIGMIALGLACENAAMILGQPWTALWLIFWVITNVSTAFYSIDLAPHFYYWGYAWPLHNIVEASRSTLFDLHSRIGLNLGILFAWCAINTVLFPIACLWQRRQTQKEKQKEEEKDE